MRRIFLLLMILAGLIPLAGYGQTYISGYYGTEIWAPNGNPYIVTGDVVIYTLFVEAGVEVYFDALCDIHVDDKLAFN